MGLVLEDRVDIVSELAYGDTGVAFTSFISILGTVGLVLYGTEEAKERYLAPMAQEGHCCAAVPTERAAGSELTKIATIASRTGDGWAINGEKEFSTNSDFARFLVVFAPSATTAGEHLAVIVPRDSEGLRITKRWEMIGLRSSGTYQVSFELPRRVAGRA